MKEHSAIVVSTLDLGSIEKRFVSRVSDGSAMRDEAKPPFRLWRLDVKSAPESRTVRSIVSGVPPKFNLEVPYSTVCC